MEEMGAREGAGARRGEEEKAESGNAEKLKGGGREIFSHGGTGSTAGGRRKSFEFRYGGRGEFSGFRRAWSGEWKRGVPAEAGGEEEKAEILNS